MFSRRFLEVETGELLGALERVDYRSPQAYDIIETRLDHFKTVAQAIDRELADDIEQLQGLQDWFRRESDDAFLQGRLMRRVRTWPEGYPGDFKTLEMLYANAPVRGTGIGPHIDRYLLTRTLAVAVRSRLSKLSQVLDQRAAAEHGSSTWLNLGCGPCRELLSIAEAKNRTVHCVDRDASALSHARSLLSSAGRNGNGVRFVEQNVLRLANAKLIQRRFGELTTIYSAGLFDYLPNRLLSKLIGELYRSLAPGGALIAPFKDKNRYETFDYHWLAKWDFFFQRSEDDFRALLADAGIPPEKLVVERDDSGVILFFIASR